MMISSRRTFLAGMATLFAAPAIVKASSLMAVRPYIGDGVALTSIAHPCDFDTDDLIIRSTERYVYGYVDERFLALYGSRDAFSSPDVVETVEIEIRDLPDLGRRLFPFDAESRGYDMGLFRETWSHCGSILAPRRV